MENNSIETVGGVVKLVNIHLTLQEEIRSSTREYIFTYKSDGLPLLLVQPRCYGSEGEPAPLSPFRGLKSKL